MTLRVLGLAVDGLTLFGLPLAVCAGVTWAAKLALMWLVGQ